MQTLDAQAVAASQYTFGLSVGRNASATLLIVSIVLVFAAMLVPRNPPLGFPASVTLGIGRQSLSGSMRTPPYEDFGNATREFESDLIARWQPLIEEASQRFSVPATWITAVMTAESGGRTEINGRPITSRVGAAGLMQLMSSTFRDMREAYGLGSDIQNPRDNILAGAAYLNLLRRRYGYPAMFAAYNAGPARLDDHLMHGRSLPRETRDYLGIVTRLIRTTPARFKANSPEWVFVTGPRRKQNEG